MVFRTIAASLAVLVGLLCAGYAIPAPNHKKMKVTTFYEVQDPASVDFIASQLYPTYLQIGSSWLNVEFVPYGLAHSDYSVDPCKVFCHNAANNCDLDKYATCGIRHLMENSDKLIRFVNCVSENRETTFMANGPCARDAGLLGREDPYDCANKSVGEDELCYMGSLTPKNITSVPLVYIDDRSVKEEELKEILSDFLLYACNRLGRQPPACQHTLLEGTVPNIEEHRKSIP